MDGDKTTRDEPEEAEESDELEAKELDQDDLDKVAGGDPGHTHPDIPDVWPGG